MSHHEAKPSNAAHSPGPWEAKPETDYVPAQVWADGRQLAEIYGETRIARQANARLIAAAPALYAALKAVLDAASINGTFGIPATKGRALLLDRGEESQARAALALVEGGQ